MKETEEDFENFKEEIEEEITYQQALDLIGEHGELSLVIPEEEEAKLRTGIKNLKARSTSMDIDSKLMFSSIPSTEFLGCVVLTVTLIKKNVVKVKKITIPEGF